jgi:putative oxidoreductase
MPNLDAWSPRVLSILRIVTGLLFAQHGMMNLFHIPAPQPGAPDPLGTMLTIGSWIDLIGGLMIALGLFTRLAAFICSGMMAVAYFTYHLPNGVYPALNGGEPAVLDCFMFFYLVFAGGGAWSFDALLRKERPTTVAASSMPRLATRLDGGQPTAG